MKNLFKKAHEMAGEIKRKYNDVDYKVQFSLCLSFLNKKGDIKLKELNGSEKQIKWANNIRKDILILVDELEKIDIEEIKKWKEDDTVKIIEKRKRKIERIREEIRNIDSAKFFIDNFRYILEYNSLTQKSAYINRTLKDSSFAEKNRNWGFLQAETQAPYKLKKIKDYNTTYEEAKEKAKEITFNNLWANEIKENVLEVVEIFDDAAKQAPNTYEIEKTKEYIIETLIQENPNFYINGFKEVKKKAIEKCRNIEEPKRKIEIIWSLFYEAVNC
ncbi:hypothetical protein ACWTV9_09250 [Clostridioides difficile]